MSRWEISLLSKYSFLHTIRKVIPAGSGIHSSYLAKIVCVVIRSIPADDTVTSAMASQPSS
jgi:hypothetical protein